MRPKTALDRYWAEIARGTPLGEIEAREPALPPRATQRLALARAIRDLGNEVRAPDPMVTWAGLEARLDKRLATVHVLRPPARRFSSVAVRSSAGLAAGLLVVVVLSMRSLPGSPLYPLRLDLERTALILSPSDSGLHLRLAEARLDDLRHALADGPAADGPALAGALLKERNAAEAGGADVEALDNLIARGVPTALSGVPISIAEQVRIALGSLLPPPSDSLGSSSEGDSDAGSTSGSDGAGPDEGSGDSSEHQGDGASDHESATETPGSSDGADQSGSSTSDGDQGGAQDENGGDQGGGAGQQGNDGGSGDGGSSGSHDGSGGDGTQEAQAGSPASGGDTQ